MGSSSLRSDSSRAPTRPQLLGALSLGLLVVVATAIGAGAALLINRRLDPRLHVATDIIGYPTFHDFNAYIYSEQYYLAVVAFPLVTIVVLFLAVRAWRRMHLPLPEFRAPGIDGAGDIPGEAPDGSRAPVIAAAVARVLVVGAVLGLVVAVGRGDSGGRVARDAIAVALVYAALLGTVSWTLSRRLGMSSIVHVARANTVGAVLSLAGLLVASQVTQVTVVSDGTVHHYPWLPVWLGLTAVAAGLLVMARLLVSAGTGVRRVALIERRAVFLVAIPVGLFLLLSSLPGVVGQFSAFENGQSLTSLRLVQTGAFPWRDWATTHGVLEDALQPLLSSALIQDTYWGSTAGYTLLVVPVCLLAMYFLAYRVLGHVWPFLVVLAVIFFDPGYITVYLRFAFWPLLLILLGVVITRRRPWLAAALGGALVAQAVLSQETAYCIPAVGLAIMGSDAQRINWRQRGARLRGFSMTFWTAVGGAAVTTLLVIILLSQHALGDFIRFYTAFVPGHTLTGGIPHLPFTGYYRKMAVAPVVALVAAIALLVAKLWTRRRLSPLDWMLVAAAVLTFLYYPKFLDRADLHVGEAFATAIPLFLVLTAATLRLLEPVAGRLWRSRFAVTAFRYALGGALMLAVLVHAPVSASAVLTAPPSNLRMVAASEPSIAALGYQAPGAIDPTLLSDIGTFLHAYLRPGDHVFDFTNEPGLLYYLLDFRPSTPYYSVSVAIRQVVQQDLVDRLRADNPVFVVYAQRGEGVGLPSWDDIPNMVRHYDVSQYVLANYHPFAQVHQQVIYVRNGAAVADPASLNLSLSSPPVTTDLPFRGSRCDWGFAPNFLSVAPAAPSAGHDPVTVTLTRDGPTGYVLTLPPGRRWDEFHWFEMNAATTFTPAQLELLDIPPPQGEERAIRFWTFDRSPARYRFPIGACSQWPGYGAAPLHLTMTTPQDIASVQVLP
jgi:hypothetical protein